MARKRKRSRRKSDDSWPGWIWMMFGLAIGLSVAAAIWFRQVPEPVVQVSAPVETAREPTVPTPATRTDDVSDESEEEERFAFYDLLKKMKVGPDSELSESDDGSSRTGTSTRAIEEEGTYYLQAGSFSRKPDAERRRAELGFLGIESRVVRARVNGDVRYRTFIGPISDLDRLNLILRQLDEAGIDVLPKSAD
ncbi:MAG: SPOR domain-containing protein [Pseudomonadota bacterium]